jgi:hypothetical protein
VQWRASRPPSFVVLRDFPLGEIGVMDDPPFIGDRDDRQGWLRAADPSLTAAVRRPMLLLGEVTMAINPWVAVP